MIDWHLEVLAIKDLKDHPKNPRQMSKHFVEKLQQNLKKFGLIDKPIVNKDLTIIGGHQRIKILKKMKAKNVECWMSNRQLEESEIDELCIGLNLHQGEWDWDILADQWEALNLLDYGFTEEKLLGEFKKNSIIEEILCEDEIEDEIEINKEEEPITKLGDLYILGEHRLICGDSTSPEVVSKLFFNDEPILMVTDPPYGVNYDPNWRSNAGKGKIKASGKVVNDDIVNWSIAYSLFKGSIAYVWHSGKYSPEVAQNLKDCEFDIISQIMWNKQHFALSRGDYHWKHEPCWYAVRKGCHHNWKGDRKQSTVWDIKSLNSFGKNKEEDERTNHSTQKPLECMARPIQNHTDLGDYIYDPFLGSGTTLIAAEKLKRKCLGVELSTIYCDVIVKRYINFRIKKGEEAVIFRNGVICKDFK